jgi:hypothetical protein
MWAGSVISGTVISGRYGALGIEPVWQSETVRMRSS